MKKKEQTKRYKKAVEEELRTTKELAKHMKGLRLKLLWDVHNEHVSELKRIYNQD